MVVPFLLRTHVVHAPGATIERMWLHCRLMHAAAATVMGSHVQAATAVVAGMMHAASAMGQTLSVDF